MFGRGGVFGRDEEEEEEDDDDDDDDDDEDVDDDDVVVVVEEDEEDEREKSRWCKRKPDVGWKGDEEIWNKVIEAPGNNKKGGRGEDKSIVKEKEVREETGNVWER